MNLTKTIFFTSIVIINQLSYIVIGEELFLDQHIHELDPFSILQEDLQLEYDYLKVQQQRNGTSILHNDPENNVTWSFKLMDYIDLDNETEDRFVRLQFLKLNDTDSFNVIGIEAIESAKMQRIFISQIGNVGYCYQNEFRFNSKGQKIYLAKALFKEQTFYFEEGDIVQVFYYAEEKSLLIYNSTKDNLFKFSEPLLSLAGRRFKVFVGISHYEDHVLLSNTF